MNRSLDAIILRYVGYALVFLMTAYLLYMVRGALPIFGVAGLLAYALEPSLQRMERRGHSRHSAVGMVFLGFLLVLAVVVALLVAAFEQGQMLAARFPHYQNQITHIIEANRQRLDHSRLPQNFKLAITQSVDDMQRQAPGMVRDKLKEVLSWTPALLGSLLLMLVILPIITLWFMVEMNPLRIRLLMIVPAAYRRDVIEIASHINELLGRYVRGQMIVCTLFGVLCTIAFQVLHMIYGMDYGLILGGVAVFLYIVPYVGMATIAISAASAGYFTSSAPVPCALIAVACCVVFNLVIDYGITPRVLGKGVGLHPLMVIFALLSGAQVGGILGMILAVPFFASLRVVAIHLFPQLNAPIPAAPAEAEAGSTAEANEHTLQQTHQSESVVAVPAQPEVALR